VSALVEIDPKHPCDRCGHRSNQHALPVAGSACAVVERYAPGTNRAIRCFCDGYFPIQTRSA